MNVWARLPTEMKGEQWQWCRWNGVMGAFAWLRRRASECREGETWDFVLCACNISICETATVVYWAKRTRRKGQLPVDQILWLCLDTHPTQIHFVVFCSLNSRKPVKIVCLQTPIQTISLWYHDGHEQRQYFLFSISSFHADSSSQ